MADPNITFDSMPGLIRVRQEPVEQASLDYKPSRMQKVMQTVQRKLTGARKKYPVKTEPLIRVPSVRGRSPILGPRRPSRLSRSQTVFMSPDSGSADSQPHMEFSPRYIYRYKDFQCGHRLEASFWMSDTKDAQKVARQDPRHDGSQCNPKVVRVKEDCDECLAQQRITRCSA
ncbi:MAG: hypothetical protein M1827_005436 [Pycnora praestabilis]|nr:MAG: hypothetical protein M1827_005436 [Pycnora praestabilis]